LFALSWGAAGTFGLDLFGVPRLGAPEIAIGAIALAAQFAFMLLARAMHSPAERRKLPVYRIVPRTSSEWLLWLPVCSAAGLAEEAAYRGVLVSIFSYSLGSFAAACILSAVVFAVSHAMQGWKSGVVIFFMALSMHVLAVMTGTLVVGMVVHAVYDVGAGIVAAWRIRTDQLELEFAGEPNSVEQQSNKS
jgi:membrane protease YdiL (CAAX protease family)